MRVIKTIADKIIVLKDGLVVEKNKSKYKIAKNALAGVK